MLVDDSELEGYLAAQDDALQLDTANDFSRLDFRPIEYVKEQYNAVSYSELHSYVVPELEDREERETQQMMRLVIEHLETFVRVKDSLDVLKESATSAEALSALDDAAEAFGAAREECLDTLDEPFTAQKEVFRLREVETLAHRLSNLAHVPEVLRDESLQAMRSLHRRRSDYASGQIGGDGAERNKDESSDSNDSDSDADSDDLDEAVTGGGYKNAVSAHLNANTFRATGELEGAVMALTRAVLFISEHVEGNAERTAGGTAGTGTTTAGEKEGTAFTSLSMSTQQEALMAIGSRLANSTIIPLLIQQMYNAANLLLEALFAQLELGLEVAHLRPDSSVVTEQRLLWMLQVANHQRTLQTFLAAVELVNKATPGPAPSSVAASVRETEDGSEADEESSEADSDRETGTTSDKRSEATSATMTTATLLRASKLGTNAGSPSGMQQGFDGAPRHPIQAYLDGMTTTTVRNMRRQLFTALRNATNMPLASFRHRRQKRSFGSKVAPDGEEIGLDGELEQSDDDVLLPESDSQIVLDEETVQNTPFDRNASFAYFGAYLGNEQALAAAAAGGPARCDATQVEVFGVPVERVFEASSAVLVRLAYQGAGGAKTGSASSWHQTPQSVAVPPLDDVASRLATTSPIVNLVQSITEEVTSTIRRYWLGIHQSVATGRFDKYSVVDAAGLSRKGSESLRRGGSGGLSSALVMSSTVTGLSATLALTEARFTCRSPLGLRQTSFTSIARTINELQKTLLTIVQGMCHSDIQALRRVMPRRESEDDIRAAFQYELTLSHWLAVLGNIETAASMLGRTFISTPAHQGDNTVWGPLHTLRYECQALFVDAVEQLTKLYLYRSYRPAAKGAEISRRLSANVLSTSNPSVFLNALMFSLENIADLIFATAATEGEAEQYHSTSFFRTSEAIMTVTLPVVQRVLDSVGTLILHFVDVVRLQALKPQPNRSTALDLHRDSTATRGGKEATMATNNPASIAVCGCIADCIAIADVLLRIFNDGVLQGMFWTPLQEWITLLGVASGGGKERGTTGSGRVRADDKARITELLSVCSALADDFQRGICPQLDQVVSLAVDVMVKAFLEKQSNIITHYVIVNGVLRCGTDWQGTSEPPSIRPYLFRALELILEAHSQFSVIEQPMLRSMVVRQLMSHLGSAFLVAVEQYRMLDGWDGSPSWVSFGTLLLCAEGEFLISAIEETCRGIPTSAKPEVIQQMHRFCQSLQLVCSQQQHSSSQMAPKGTSSGNSVVAPLLRPFSENEWRKSKERLVSNANNESRAVFDALMAQPAAKKSLAPKPSSTTAPQEPDWGAALSLFGDATSMDELAKKVAAHSMEDIHAAAGGTLAGGGTGKGKVQLAGEKLKAAAVTVAAMAALAKAIPVQDQGEGVSEQPTQEGEPAPTAGAGLAATAAAVGKFRRAKKVKVSIQEQEGAEKTEEPTAGEAGAGGTDRTETEASGQPQREKHRKKKVKHTAAPKATATGAKADHHTGGSKFARRKK